MPTSRSTGQTAEDQRRELHTQIARVRRRLNRRVERIADGGLLLGSWRGYVREYPGRSVVAAAGIGMLLSGFVGRDRDVSRFGDRLCDLATGTSWSVICRQIQQLVASHGRDPDSTQAEADHE